MESGTDKIPLPGNLDSIQDETAFDRIVKNLDALPSGFLQVVSGEHIGRIVLLNRSMTRLSLSGNCCAVVVYRGKDGYFLTHLEGTKEPLVDGQPTGITPSPLTEGSTIEFDGMTLKFHKGKSYPADNIT